MRNKFPGKYAIKNAKKEQLQKWIDELVPGNDREYDLMNRMYDRLEELQ